MRIGFVGAGQMARALATGFVSKGLLKSSDLLAYDCSEAACQDFTTAFAGADIAASNRAVVAGSEIVILAVKPQQMADVMAEVGRVTSETLIVSIAAGVTLDRLAAGFKTDRIVRVMPNTPCLIGQGASGYSLGIGVRPEEGEQIQRLLEAVGICFQVPESLMDAVTGLSGSGPAFVFQFIEALSDGAVRMGLPRETALRLAAQTVAGSAHLVLTTGDHPSILKDRVASPGGTTMAGIAALEESGFRGVVMSAVRAATERSRELGG